MNIISDFVEKLDECPLGSEGWHKFEQICTEILTFLFVPPLAPPTIQARSYSGIDRRDAVFPNRNFTPTNIWGSIFAELGARLILVEFKNYDATSIGKEEVDQTRNYLNQPMGKLAIIVCSKPPDESAHIRRNTIYSSEKKVILFVSKEHLKEMLFIKERGGDPADLIMDLIEKFYIQHE